MPVHVELTMAPPKTMVMEFAFHSLLICVGLSMPSNTSLPPCEHPSFCRQQPCPGCASHVGAEGATGCMASALRPALATPTLSATDRAFLMV